MWDVIKYILHKSFLRGERRRATCLSSSIRRHFTIIPGVILFQALRIKFLVSGYLMFHQTSPFFRNGKSGGGGGISFKHRLYIIVLGNGSREVAPFTSAVDPVIKSASHFSDSDYDAMSFIAVEEERKRRRMRDRASSKVHELISPR